MNDFTTADTRSTGKATLAHMLTYPEMLAAKDGVMNPQGIMISGPDRKFDDEGMKFRAWQKAVQHASNDLGAVPAGVMLYFQETKHLTRPPKAGDLNILQAGPIEDALIVEKLPGVNVATEKIIEVLESSVAFKPPRFTWSWSQYSSFMTCPAKWLAEKYFKIIPYIESEAMRTGNMMHETAEHFVKQQIGETHQQSKIHSQYLPMVRKYCDVLVNAHKAGAKVFVEHEMCVTNTFKQCGWWDNDMVWYRGKADAMILKGDKLVVWDYKSGKLKPELEQLKLMCAFGALFYPEAQVFDGKLIFTAHDKVVGFDKTLTRAELRPVITDVIANVRRMEATWEMGEGPARKNGLCKAYCGNFNCPHSGNYRG